MDKQLYWVGSENLNWKAGERNLISGDPITEAVIKQVGREQIEDLLKKGYISDFTADMARRQAVGNTQAALKEALKEVAVLTKERDQSAADQQDQITRPVYNKVVEDFKKLQDENQELIKLNTESVANLKIAVEKEAETKTNNKKLHRTIAALDKELGKQQKKEGADSSSEILDNLDTNQGAGPLSSKNKKNENITTDNSPKK